ncbi:MAG: hypothetical protein LBU65_06325 [Planctomycetaceae bacterium]|nr:hypothetical protein [Planctomycetaceae bacterium]
MTRFDVFGYSDVTWLVAFYYVPQTVYWENFARLGLTEFYYIMSIPQQIESSYLMSSPRAVALPIDVSSRRSLSLELDFSRAEGSSTATRPYLLFSPIHYEPAYAYPLIVWLHGAGCDERQVTRVMTSMSMRNYVAVAPRGFEVGVQQVEKQCKAGFGKQTAGALDVNDALDGIDGKRMFYDWSQSPSLLGEAEQSVFECVDLAAKRCNISRNRIFLVGFDSGGTMALRLGMLHPDYFAGVVSLCGAFPHGNLPLRQWTAARHLPTLLTVGHNSEVFTPQQASQMLTLYHSAGMPIIVRDYQCGQELIPEMLQETNRWIMERVCGSETDSYANR